MFHICCQSRLRLYDNLILVGEQKYRTVVTKKKLSFRTTSSSILLITSKYCFLLSNDQSSIFMHFVLLTGMLLLVIIFYLYHFIYRTNIFMSILSIFYLNLATFIVQMN